MKLDARQLRDLPEKTVSPKIKRHPVYLIMDNIMDTYNIGGTFRLADALAVEKIYICGESETPPNHRIAKASVGTYKVVPWEYYPSASEAIAKLKVVDPMMQFIAIEQHEKAIPYTKFEYKLPFALVVGHESEGVAKKTLDSCDAIVEIPMHGVNKSLNVIVSAAVVAFHAYNKLDLS